MEPKFKSEKKIKPDILLQKLKDISSVKDDGRVSFDAFEHEDLEWIFLSLLDFGRYLNIDSKKHILKNTFKELVLNQKFDKDFFFDTLIKKIKLHQNKPEKDYYLLSSLSIEKLPFRKIEIGNCQILVKGRYFPKKFRKYRNEIHNTFYKKKEINDYLKIVVKIKAKDFKDAYEESYKTLEIFRAFLCLLLNDSAVLQINNKQLIKPINKVRLGEFSSLHFEDGTCADNRFYWFEPHYIKADLLKLEASKSEILKKNIKWLVKKYNVCQARHKDTLRKALILYVGAYDEANKYLCFLRAWTTLETIVNSDDNEMLIKRCSSIYSDDLRLYQKQFLEGLRHYRNEYVHEGSNSLSPYNACFKLQEYIYHLIIRFNLNYAGFFKNIDEANNYIDNLRLDLKELQSRQKIIDKSIKIKQIEKNTKR